MNNALDHLGRLSAESQVSKGDDGGEYINVDYTTTNLASLWDSVRQKLATIPGLADSAIVACEGKLGWDDYLLLHDYDPLEPLDKLE